MSTLYFCPDKATSFWVFLFSRVEKPTPIFIADKPVKQAGNKAPVSWFFGFHIVLNRPAHTRQLKVMLDYITIFLTNT